MDLIGEETRAWLKDRWAEFLDRFPQPETLEQLADGVQGVGELCRAIQPVVERGCASRRYIEAWLWNQVLEKVKRTSAWTDFREQEPDTRELDLIGPFILDKVLPEWIQTQTQEVADA